MSGSKCVRALVRFEAERTPSAEPPARGLAGAAEVRQWWRPSHHHRTSAGLCGFSRSVHARSVHARPVHARSAHARSVHARSVHACSAHACSSRPRGSAWSTLSSVHAQLVHARSVHAQLVHARLRMHLRAHVPEPPEGVARSQLKGSAWPDTPLAFPVTGWLCDALVSGFAGLAPASV